MFFFFFIPHHCFLWLFGCFLSIWCIPQFSRSINMKYFEPFPIFGVFLLHIHLFRLFRDFVLCLLCETQCMYEYSSLPCRTWMLNNIGLHLLNVCYTYVKSASLCETRQCLCVNTTDSSCSRHFRSVFRFSASHLEGVHICIDASFLNRCEHSRKYFSDFFRYPSFVRSFFWFNCFESKNSKWFDFLKKIV